jgi:hypothetical protein
MSFLYKKCNKGCNIQPFEPTQTFSTVRCVCDKIPSTECLIYPISYDRVLEVLDELKRHITILKNDNERRCTTL